MFLCAHILGLSMPQVGFETTIPVFEQAKTVHALDRAATVIGLHIDDTDVYKPIFETLQELNTR
jgi:hypothetical protein